MAPSTTVCDDGSYSEQSTSKSLRTLILDHETTFLMEAHDALSAAIVAQVGFEGIWASGLSISASLGFRDANEASWTQIAEVVERMAHVVSIPILVDGDTGFGNFNNARLFAKKLQQVGASGVCLEDKLFPKMNSFVGNRHPLADVREFCGRLKAVRDAVGTERFVVAARVEALIAGHGQNEALERAHAYADAGADAILIHSRQSDAGEILAFAAAWRNRKPVIIVPTKYYRTPTAAFRQAGISTIIWANHSMRAAAAAMLHVCGRIREEESIAQIESQVASLDRIFALMSYDELEASENRYLPRHDVAE